MVTKVIVPKGLRHLRMLSFETLIAVLALVSGTLSLFHYGGVASDALTQALSSWLNNVFAAIYAISGAAMLFGLILGRRDIEAFGLTTLVSSVLIRSIVLFFVVGLSSLAVTSYVFNAVIVWACVERLLLISQGGILIISGGEEHGAT